MHPTARPTPIPPFARSHCITGPWLTTPDRHRRTTKANRARSSAVEHLLCKEDALGSTPSGSIPGHERGDETRLLSGAGSDFESHRTDALSRESADRKGSTNAPAATGRSMTTIVRAQSRRPLNPSSPTATVDVTDHQQQQRQQSSRTSCPGHRPRLRLSQQTVTRHTTLHSIRHGSLDDPLELTGYCTGW